MNSTARYHAAEIMQTIGYFAALDYIRGHVGGCRTIATAIADEIAHYGE